MFRLLLTRRWLGYMALTIAFAVVASMFGMWQWERRGEAVAAIEKVESNYDRDPISLSALIKSGPLSAQELEWIPVIATGRYLVGEEVLVRTRPRAGSVGFEVLVPFVTDGVSVMVNRGWIPTGETQDFPDDVPDAPPGVIELLGRIKPTEPLLPGRGAPQGQIASIHLGSLQQTSSVEIREDFFLALGEENPPPVQPPLPTLRPDLDEGPHLSYTFQWYLFALMAFGGLGYMLRQEVRSHRGEDVSRKASRDDQEEDALLDGAGR